MKKPQTDALWHVFGAWIKEQREGKRLSQAEAAQKAGIDRQQWYRIESGKSGTKRETVLSMADALSADADEALTRAGYAPLTPPISKPTNAAEFHDVIESLGIEEFHNLEGIRDLSPNEYQRLLESVRLAIDLTLRRQQRETARQN